MHRAELMMGSEFFSVRGYESAVDHAQRLTSPRAKLFWGLTWAEDAPRPEELTEEWNRSLRICDPELYDRQMRELIGLA